LEFGDRELTHEDTLAGFEEDSPRLVIRGRVYEADGTTPAEGVIIYIHQTNSAGVYPHRGDETGWARRHGYLRGWIRTGADGRYAFYTVRPGPYPDGTLPAHIHGVVLEPDGRYYWIDDWNFTGDPLLRPEDLDESTAYGGAGLVTLIEEEGRLVAERDIILGYRVPAYARDPK
jgi:protocatechuate 3,4-dioxygenase beta subunit